MIRYARSLSPFAVADPDVLGRKGADLVELVQLGLPVPPAFSVTTETCRHVLEHQVEPDGFHRELARELGIIEEQVGRRFGDPGNPLLVSVRPGDVPPAPGAMATILDIGLNDQTVAGLAEASGSDRFALDCYRRLLQGFGVAVGGVSAERYRDVPEPGGEPGVLREVVEHHKAVFEEHTGRAFPQDPQEQLGMALLAALRSATGGPATAAIVQAMVFGNRGSRSGSGVAFTRNPMTSEPGDSGQYLPMGQGEDVESGLEDVLPLAALRRADPASYRRLRSLMGTLERHHCDMCRIEFTVEEGRLWVLEAVVGDRSPAAADRIAVDIADEGWSRRTSSDCTAS